MMKCCSFRRYYAAVGCRSSATTTTTQFESKIIEILMRQPARD
jgi:hypothetical protein